MGKTGLGPDGDPAEHDHGSLLSALNDRDLAVASGLDRRDAEPEAFRFDPDADPDAVFPQSVASTLPTPSLKWTSGTS